MEFNPTQIYNLQALCCVTEKAMLGLLLGFKIEEIKMTLEELPAAGFKCFFNVSIYNPFQWWYPLFYNLK
jgi:hypothetical protein